MAAMNKAQAQRYRQQRTTSYGAEPGEITRGLKPGDRYYDPDNNTWQLKPGRGIPGAVGVGDTVSDYVDQVMNATGDANASRNTSPGSSGSQSSSTGGRPQGNQGEAGAGSEGQVGGGQVSQGGGGRGGQTSSTTKAVTPKNDPEVEQAVANGFDVTPWLVGGGLAAGAIIAARTFNRKGRRKGTTSGAASPVTDTAGVADKGGTGKTPNKSTAAADATASVAMPDERALAAAMSPAAELADPIKAAMASSAAAAVPKGPGVVDVGDASDTPDVAKAKVASMLGESDPTGSITEDFGNKVGAGAGLVDPYSIAPVLGADAVMPPPSEGPSVEAGARAVADAAEASRPGSAEAPTPRPSPIDESINSTIAGPDKVEPDLGPVIPEAAPEGRTPERGMRVYPQSPESLADDASINQAKARLLTNDLSDNKTIPQIIADTIMGRKDYPSATRENPNLPPEFRETLRRRRAQVGMSPNQGRTMRPASGPTTLDEFLDTIYSGGNSEYPASSEVGGPRGGAAWTPAEYLQQLMTGEKGGIQVNEPDILGGTNGQKILAVTENLIKVTGAKTKEEALADPRMKSVYERMPENIRALTDEAFRRLLPHMIR